MTNLHLKPDEAAIIFQPGAVQLSVPTMDDDADCPQHITLAFAIAILLRADMGFEEYALAQLEKVTGKIAEQPAEPDAPNLPTCPKCGAVELGDECDICGAEMSAG